MGKNIFNISGPSFNFVAGRIGVYLSEHPDLIRPEILILQVTEGKSHIYVAILWSENINKSIITKEMGDVCPECGEPAIYTIESYLQCGACGPHSIPLRE